MLAPKLACPPLVGHCASPASATAPAGRPPLTHTLPPLLLLLLPLPIQVRTNFPSLVTHLQNLALEGQLGSRMANASWTHGVGACRRPTLEGLGLGAVDPAGPGLLAAQGAQAAEAVAIAADMAGTEKPAQLLSPQPSGPPPRPVAPWVGGPRAHSNPLSVAHPPPPGGLAYSLSLPPARYLVPGGAPSVQPQPSLGAPAGDFNKPSFNKPSFNKPSFNKPSFNKPSFNKPSFSKVSYNR